MKNIYSLLLIIVLILSNTMYAQTSTEQFETESNGSTSFTDNGVIFNIISHASTFDIQANYPATGWSGTNIDNRYIDNSLTPQNGASFSIKTTSNLFKVNRFWVYLSDANLNLSTAGTLTITGKLSGVTKFTQTKTTGFNTSVATANGYTLIDLTNLNGQNYSNIIIDQLQITLGGGYTYAALDAFTWVKDSNLVIDLDTPTVTLSSQTNVACNGSATGAATVSVSGGTAPYTYSWSPSGGTAATATGLVAGTYTVTVTDATNKTKSLPVTITQPAALTATTSLTNVSCNGGGNGVASVVASGGSGGYSYSWAPSGGTGATATGLTAGTYICTITDANLCQITRTVTISQPATALSASISSTNVSCNGGSNGTATVSASGGTPGYTYLWSPSGGTAASATGLSVGVYTCLITDANGCSVTRNVTITQPIAMNATTVQTNIACNGQPTGSLTVNVTGGTGQYTYLWSPSGGTAATATGLTAGAYTVTVTDANNGCILTRNFTITQPSSITATTSSTNVSCNGGNNGAASVVASGGAGGYTYSWSPSGGTGATATGLTAGTYICTITDANLCQITRTVTITQPAPITTTASVTHVSCNGGSNGTASVTASGGIGTYTYSWAPSGGINATATGLTAGTYTCTVTDANGCQATRTVTVTQPTALTATTSMTNVSCNGGSNGSATVNVSGGTAGYTYLWIPSGGTAASATGLSVGVYNCIITDANGCTLTKSFTITQPTAMIITPSQVNVTCNGATNGSATVSVVGGAGTYTYSWSPSGGTAATATGLSAGTYTVTVTDANNCTKTQSFTITQPSPIVATTSQNNVSCNGGSNGTATVSVSGGIGTYTYLWSPSGGTAATATGLMAGIYTCTITDANLCQITRTFTITQPSPITATIAQTNVSCNGGANGTASVTPSGGTGTYTYSWSPSGGTAATATGLVAGVYTCTITDANGCTLTRSVTITQPTAMVATTSQTNVLCNGSANATASVIPSGGAGQYTYLWSPSGGTAATATGLAAGVYTCTITDANGCILTKTFTITQPTNINIIPSQTNLSCNGGSNGSATVSVSGGTGTYTYSWSPSGGTAATATGLSAGVYNVTVTDANGCTATQSFTITEPAALSAVLSPTKINVSCNGGTNGSATVIGVGGTGSYTYSWSPSGGNAATATGLAAGIYTVTVTDANGCTAIQTVEIEQPAVLASTLASVQTNVSCYGASDGSATVDIIGGTGLYTYSWSPSGGTSATADGLSAGTYVCTVNDANGCMTTQSFTITEPPVLTATALSQTNISCNGASNGSATVEVTGGTGAYTYLWSPSGGTAITATDLTAGTYICTVMDANGCTTTQSFTLTEPAVMTTSIVAQTNVVCNGNSNGSATIEVMGGTGAYTYLWSPSGGTQASATDLAAGIYEVIITDDNGCTTTQEVTITEPAVVLPPAIISPQEFCIAADATIDNLEIEGVQIKWYATADAVTELPTDTVLANGTYFASQTIDGCESQERASVEVIINDILPTPVGAPNQQFEEGATIADLVVEPVTVTWYATYENAVDNVDALSTSEVLVNGATYYAVVVATDECSSLPFAVTVNVTAGIENFQKDTIEYYPNPVEDYLRIKSSGIVTKVEVYNLLGRVVKKQDYQSNEVELFFADLPSATYVVFIKSGNKESFIKVVKK